MAHRGRDRRDAIGLEALADALGQLVQAHALATGCDRLAPGRAADLLEQPGVSHERVGRGQRGARAQRVHEHGERGDGARAVGGLGQVVRHQRPEIRRGLLADVRVIDAQRYGLRPVLRRDGLRSARSGRGRDPEQARERKRAPEQPPRLRSPGCHAHRRARRRRMRKRRQIHPPGLATRSARGRAACLDPGQPAPRTRSDRGRSGRVRRSRAPHPGHVRCSASRR
jgi:hypothetical protein